MVTIMNDELKYNDVIALIMAAISIRANEMSRKTMWNGGDL